MRGNTNSLIGALLALAPLVGCAESGTGVVDGGGAAKNTTGGAPGGSSGAGTGLSGARGGAPSPGVGGGSGNGNSGGLQGGSGGGGAVSGGLGGSGGGRGGSEHAGTSGGAGEAGSTQGSCPGLPAVTDYAAQGPFDVTVVPNTGPDGTYYLFRPDTTLGKNGFKHPVAVWGNGILTTPDQYQTLLGHIASHGIVVIACPSTQPERPCLDAGIEWLIEQNDIDGPLKGKLDTSKEITIGYSWGGGAAIDTANRANVKATISLHGMPPREADAWTAMKSPLLLFTSTGDTFVSAEEYVTPNFVSSQVPTFYATLDEAVGHLYPLDTTAISCVASVALGGPCAAALKEQAPIVAWIRLWACDDSRARSYFYGPNCELCKSPWLAQTKPPGAW